MIRSMTGLGVGEVTRGRTVYRAEVRSVNHRFCEVSLKLPREMAGAEQKIRGLITSRFSRGRFDLSLVRNGAAGEETRPALDLAAAASYHGMLKTLEDRFQIREGIRAVDLLMLRDVLTFEPVEPDPGVEKASLQAVEKALERLELMRRTEGKALGSDLKKRIDAIERKVDRIEKRVPAVLKEYGTRLRRSVEEFTGRKEIDRDRLLQEMALMADRRDISEEVVRLRSHIAQFRKIMGEESEVGRRLDFLAQEIHREVNTIASKSGDAEVSHETVEIKSTLEKIREQVQNVE